MHSESETLGLKLGNLCFTLKIENPLTKIENPLTRDTDSTTAGTQETPYLNVKN